jgi:hypothetical protein
VWLRDFLQNPPAWALKIGQAALPIARPIYRKLRSFNAQPSKRQPMLPATRQQLQADLLPEVEALSALLGRDLTHWVKT